MLILLTLLIVALAMPGTASKLQTAREITLEGAITGNANFDGSSDIVINTNQNNFAVATGSVNLANGVGNTNIDYPEGYNKDNCVVLSFMAFNGTNVNGYGYGYLENSSGYVAGAIGHSINLGSSKIAVAVQNPISSTSGSGTYQIKIVLMKIS